MTPARLRIIVQRLADGATMGETARAAGIAPGTLAEWLSIAEHARSPLHARVSRDVAAARGTARSRNLEASAAMARATLAERESALREDREVGRQAARLIQRGATLRGAAALLGLAYESLRVLVNRGRRTGDPALAPLVEAARTRSARAPRRKPSGPFVAEPPNATACCT